MTCNIVFRSLGTLASSNMVYATGKGTGLYELNPENVGVNPAPKFPFKAVGHLEMFEEGGFAFATATSVDGPELYDRVLRLNLKSQTTSPAVEYKPKMGATFLSGNDGIAISTGDAIAPLHLSPSAAQPVEQTSSDL